MDFGTPDALETISQWFLQTLSLSNEDRRRAEACLSSAADRPGFLIALLRIVASDSASDQVRLAAAVHFQLSLRSHWTSVVIAAGEKDQIKGLILPIMLSSPSPLVRSQLSESLAIISSHDFPKAWPSLLPELVAALKSSADYNSTANLLSAANSIFLKFRHSFDTNDLRLDLKYCLDNFAGPLLELFTKTSASISSTVAPSPVSLRPLFESQRLCSEIFRSLNSIELPEFFEDHMREWMSEFLSYLTSSYPPDVEKDGGPDALRASICENLLLYLEKNEEEFRDYLKDFASAVWSLLMSHPPSPNSDVLTVTAMRFLTTISTSVHHPLFGSPQVLEQICQSVVFPALRLETDDEENFEMNFMDYIRNDIEGSDVDTRRRIACELLKGLAVNYRDQVAELVKRQIQHMLESYAANPAENWKEMDAAIYLVVSLGTKGVGSVSTGSPIVDLDGFFSSVILPELRGAVNIAPVLKADALKFFAAFRDQIPKSSAVTLLPDVMRFLACESNVVHSYAANCIDKLLLVRDKFPAAANDSNAVHYRARYGAPDVDPFLSVLMTNLFKALEFPESQENPYVMKCIMRVLGVANVIGDVARGCITQLASILSDVCKNPKNPIFNHYLFEAIAALIARSSEKDKSLVTFFEASLFPVLQNILSQDISEFWQYVFQIFAQLVEISSPPLSGSYMQMFDVLLMPESWNRSASVPALVQLLQAYLQKVPNELSNEGKVSQVLGIFKNLVSSPSSEELGFYVLNTVVENLQYNTISQYIGPIWTVLFTRLQNRRTERFVKSLIIFMSLVLVKHGPAVLVDSVNAVDNTGLFMTILEQFWIPVLKHISGNVEVKLAAVASTRLVCESPSLLDPSGAQYCGKMIDSIISLLTKPDDLSAEVEHDLPDIYESRSSAVFAPLQYARKKEVDPLKEIQDPKGFFITSLARLLTLSPGKYPGIIEMNVDPANQMILHQLFAAYNCAIV